MSFKKGNEIPTIDVAMVTITTKGATPTEIALTTANKVGVSPVIETKDAVKQIIKGKLIAQKPQESTVTGNTIVLSDNVFNPELVKILQGGTITYDDIDPTKFKKYVPPVVGSSDTGETFDVNLYSCIYDTAGTLTGYEKISYPNGRGVPIAFGSEDGVFRATEYTINSAPSTGQAPYEIEIVTTLPTVA